MFCHCLMTYHVRSDCVVFVYVLIHEVSYTSTSYRSGYFSVTVTRCEIMLIIPRTVGVSSQTTLPLTFVIHIICAVLRCFFVFTLILLVMLISICFDIALSPLS